MKLMFKETLEHPPKLPQLVSDRAAGPWEDVLEALLASASLEKSKDTFHDPIIVTQTAFLEHLCSHH